MQNDTDTQYTQERTPNKNELRIIIIFALMTTLFAMSGFLSLFVLSPLVYVFYKHGIRAFIKSAALFLIIIVSISLFTSNIFSGESNLQDNTVDTESNLLIDNEGTSSFRIDGTDASTMDLFRSIQNLQKAFAKFVSSPRYVIFDILIRVMRVLGLGLLLYFSRFSWKIRLSLGTAITSIGMLIAFLIMSQDKQMMNELSLLNIGEDNIYALIRDMFLFITPVTNAIFLMFNVFIAYLVLCIRAKVNVQSYITYVFLKLLKEVRQLKIAIPLGFLAIGYVSSLLGANGWNHIIFILFLSAAFFCALIYIVQGCVYSYFSLSRRITLHPVWYFFGNCIIMVVPLANISLASFYLMMGLLCGFKKQKQIKLEENKYEDNS